MQNPELSIRRRTPRQGQRDRSHSLPLHFHIVDILPEALQDKSVCILELATMYRNCFKYLPRRTRPLYLNGGTKCVEARRQQREVTREAIPLGKN